MKRIITLFLIASCIGILWHPKICAQKKFIGTPIIEHFDARDYKGYPTNDAITQDSRGLIYIGNVHGLLVYDGINWKHFDSPVGMSHIAAICVDPSGRIFVGSQEIGYYFPGPTGTYEFHSLNYLLPDDHHQIPGNVNKIFPYKGGYVFASPNNLYFYKNDSIKIIPITLPPSLRGLVAPNSASTNLIRGKLYMNVRGKGLSVLYGEEWKLIPNGSFFADMRIMHLFSYLNDFMLACTWDNGLYLISDQQILPFAETLWNDFRKYRIINSTKLSDGSFAIGTLSNGLYILDQQGNLVYHFNENDGLKNNAIYHTFQDSFGNIWLAHINGLTKIEWESPFSLINDKVGLSGSGKRAYASEDRIYFGTNQGLFYTEKNQPLDKVTQVDNISGMVHYLQNINGDLLISSQSGAYQLINNTFEQIAVSSADWGWLGFRKTRDPDIMLGGDDNGVYRLVKINGKWSVSNKYEMFSYFPESFEFDDDDRLWIEVGSKGVASFTFSEDYKEIVSKNVYDTTKGLSSTQNIRIFKIVDELIFSTKDGIYVYSPVEDKFISSAIWNNRFEGNVSDIYEMSVDGLGNIYYADTQQRGRLGKNIWNEYNNEYSLFNNVEFHLQNGMTNISILDETNILFSIPNGFIHYNMELTPATLYQANLLIRNVKLVLSDSVLFGGNFIADNKVVNKQPSDMIPMLSYEDNALVFSYSAVEYNKPNSMYRYQLDGLDNKWSRWTADTKKEYTNLHEGNYTFRVQTKDSNDKISPETTFQFEIGPPWHRTYLAYSGYTIGFMGLISIIFFSYRKKQKKEISKLKNEKLESEIRYKKTQLATTTLHLIDKTKFINSIKTHIHEVLKQEDGTLRHRGLNRIIKEIDSNSSNDDNWEDFEIHFDDVHENFLKRIRKDYPAITAREIRLCAYLRMNMSTKEITDLLKISVRGVEVARYRLRKKLNLNKDDNLVDYMLKY